MSYVVMSDIRFRYALEDLTARVRKYRHHMAISRDDLKKKRLQAMGVVGSHMDASAAMFDRLIAAGEKVTAARAAAETAQMGAIDAQVADLNEMAEDLVEMGNAAAPVSAATVKLEPAGLAPVTASEALAALQAAVPNPSAAAWAKGDAYLGTHPDNESRN